MTGENRRRYERVETNVRLKLPGDTAWTECSTSNVSAGGLFFESARQLNAGDFVTLQFMLQAKSGTHTNVHFFSSARVVRVAQRGDMFQIAVEFIITEDVIKEVLRNIEMIKSDNRKVNPPPTFEEILKKKKAGVILGDCRIGNGWVVWCDNWICSQRLLLLNVWQISNCPLHFIEPPQKCGQQKERAYCSAAQDVRELFQFPSSFCVCQEAPQSQSFRGGDMRRTLKVQKKTSSNYKICRW